MSDAEQESEMQLQEANGEAPEESKSSLLSQLSELHKEVKKERHLDIDIPGYEGKLFARFRPYEVSKSEKRAKAMARRLEKGQPVALAAACDTIVESCEQIFVRNEKGEELPIDDVVPVTFEKRLASLLGFDSPAITEARHVVIELFPTQQSVLATSIEISTWLNTASRETEDEFLSGN